MISCIESICIYYFALSWLSKRPPVRFRWLNLLMNVFNLFAEDDEVQIIEVRN